MASFQISDDEYLSFKNLGRRQRPWARRIKWAVAMALLIGAVYTEQYWFAALFGVLLVFVYYTFYRMTPRLDLMHRSNNPYAQGPIDIRFCDDHYEVRVGESTMKLHLNEMGRVHDFKDFYKLNHKSGVCIDVPKRALSEGEVGLLKSYFERYPGVPVNQTVPDY